MITKQGFKSVFLAVVLFWKLTYSSSSAGCLENKYGPDCRYFCHCASDSECLFTNGNCEQCIPGWYGPTCQMENIALSKRTKLRNFNNSIALKGVDGDRTSCFKVKSNDASVMRMRVQLGRIVDVHNITIFTTPDKSGEEKKEMIDMDLLLSTTSNVGKDVCYVETRDITSDGRMDMKCQGQAKNVFIRKKTQPFLLDICEVEIYVCAPHTWGVRCENYCGRCLNGVTCDQNTGHCPGGCDDGWLGSDCLTSQDGARLQNQVLASELNSESTSETTTEETTEESSPTSSPTESIDTNPGTTYSYAAETISTQTSPDSVDIVSTQTPTEFVDISTQTPTESVDTSTQTPTKFVDISTQTPTESVDTSTQTSPESVDIISTQTPTEYVDTSTQTPTESVDTSTQTPPESVDTSTQTPTESVDTSTQTPPESVDTSTQTLTESVDASTQTPPESVDTSTETPTESVDTSTQTPTESVDTSTQTLTESVDTSTQTPTESVDTSTQTLTESVDASTQTPTESVDISTQTPTESVDISTQTASTYISSDVTTDEVSTQSDVTIGLSLSSLSQTDQTTILSSLTSAPLLSTVISASYSPADSTVSEINTMSTEESTSESTTSSTSTTQSESTTEAGLTTESSTESASVTSTDYTTELTSMSSEGTTTVVTESTSVAVDTNSDITSVQNTEGSVSTTDSQTTSSSVIEMTSAVTDSSTTSLVVTSSTDDNTTDTVTTKVTTDGATSTVETVIELTTTETQSATDNTDVTTVDMSTETSTSTSVMTSTETETTTTQSTTTLDTSTATSTDITVDTTDVSTTLLVDTTVETAQGTSSVTSDNMDDTTTITTGNTVTSSDITTAERTTTTSQDITTVDDTTDSTTQETTTVVSSLSTSEITTTETPTDITTSEEATTVTTSSGITGMDTSTAGDVTTTGNEETTTRTTDTSTVTETTVTTTEGFTDTTTVSPSTMETTTESTTETTSGKTSAETSSEAYTTESSTVLSTDTTTSLSIETTSETTQATETTSATTQATEISSSTQATETTASTQAIETSASTQASETTASTQATETTASTQATETTASTQATETTASKQATETTTGEVSTTQSTTETTVTTTVSTPVIETTSVPTTQTTSIVTTMITNATTTDSTVSPGSISVVTAIVIPVIILCVLIVVIIGSMLLVVGRRRNRRQRKFNGDIPLTGLVTNGDNGYIPADDDAFVQDEMEEAVYDNVIQNNPIQVLLLQEVLKMMQEKKQFQDQFSKLPDENILPVTISKRDSNFSKNRYTNMLPFNHSRVKLKNVPDGQTDFINANYINGYGRKKVYIATQGPLERTTADFWLMTWEQRVKKIIMLTNLKERNRVKCYQYWPKDKEELKFRNLNVTMESEIEFPVYVIRKIKMVDTKTGESRLVTQYHFTSWPDHGVPDPFQLLSFHRQVSTNGFVNDPQPWIVHCSAGVGRTGTFLALDALLKEGLATQSVDILAYVTDMRKNRMKMVQTCDQLIFIHFVLMEAFACLDAALPVDTVTSMFSGPTDPKYVARVDNEYTKLNSLRPEYSEKDFQDGLHPSNVDKNRTTDVLPVDNYRVKLYTIEDTDYMNAVILPNCGSRQGYIVTQYPLPNTVEHFWNMVSNYNCNTVVLLDDGQDFEEQFYPSMEHTAELGPITLETFSIGDPQDCVTQTVFNLNNQDLGDEFEVRMFIGHGWSDDNIDSPPAKLLHCLHYEIQKYQASQMTQTPIVVVCRDGAQRSGLFCAVCNILDSIDWYNELNVFHTIRQLQIRRPEFISTKSQFEYCYHIAMNYLDTSAIYDNSAEYVNVGAVGKMQS